MGTDKIRRRRDRPGAKIPATETMKDENNNKTKSTKEQKSRAPPEEQDQTASWSVLLTNKCHPFLLGLLVLGIPYGSHLGYCWFLLQHPVPGIMRPAVGLQDPRQVLILGSMSSGTSSIADSLREDFNMEVGHEDSDARWKFVRDGTVSWFHGIRYWPKQKNDTAIISKLCAISWFITSYRDNDYGFGPALFGTPDYNCSVLHPRFQECYNHACTNALKREYGCALERIPENQGACRPVFGQTLLQTREPWKIIASLVAKYCFRDSEIVENSPNSLRWLLQALGLVTNKTAPCPVQMMDYVVGYYNTILDHAPTSTTSSLQVYPIEATSPCQVAQMAGLDHAATTIYPPNHKTFQEKCGGHNYPSSTAKAKGTPTNKQSNVINRGKVSIADLLPYATPEHLERIIALYARLGYTYEQG